MITTKKITAVLLAVILVCSVFSLNSFALDNEYIADHMKLYTDINGNYFIIRDECLYADEETTVTFYSVDSNGNKTVIKQLSNEEAISFSDNEPVSVSADTFVEGGNYEVKIVDPTEATPSDAGWFVSGVYTFTYDDLLGGTPIFSEYYHELYEGNCLDLSEFILTPVGYEGELRFTSTTYEDYFGESVIPGLRTYAEVDGTFVTAVDDGLAYIEMYDESGEYLDVCVLDIYEPEPETIFELMDSSAEKITEGLMEAVNNLGSNFITTAFLMVLPVVFPFAFFISFVFNVILFPY